MKTAKSLLTAALIAAAVPALQGCFPLVAGGVAAGALAVTDRRTVGTQTEDEAIEWKAEKRIADRFKDRAHVNVTGYNRKALITGEAYDEAMKAEIGDIVSKVENVQGVWNEMAVGPIRSFSSRSNDAYVTSKVKARFVDYNQFAANHVKVVTEGGAVYLLGIVNEREAKSAVQIARTTDGVRKVVNLLEVVSEAETRRIDSAVSSQPPKATPDQSL
ncbi:MAG: putative periplasmic or secreted lipoprotein [Rhodocyclaceae bacterium]|nr:putative periplasmic or secreted lipoprotein [Rhodocyclaceae bacterium]